MEQYIVEVLEASTAFHASRQQAVDKAIERINELRQGNFLGGANIKYLLKEGRQ